MRYPLVSTSFLVISLMLCANAALAHSRWSLSGIVKPRTSSDSGKVEPCGGFSRTNTPVTLTAGATIEVAFDSTIYHKGFFRIAFSPANDEGFDSYILADDIADISGQISRTYTITLPNVECDNCTLQLIQSMLDRSPPTNYYSCADIKLVKNTADNDTTPPQAVKHLLIMNNDTSVSLAWTNPDDSDFTGTLIIEGDQAITALPEAGQSFVVGDVLGSGRIVYTGAADNISLIDRTLATSYYYSLLAFDHAFNYSPEVRGSITLANSSQNIAPSVTLQVEQNQKTSNTIQTTGGLVTVQATIADFNPSDTHSLQWSTNNAALVNLSGNNEQYIFDPAKLSAGQYSVTVIVTDNGTPPLSASQNIDLTLKAPGVIKVGGFNYLWLCLLSFGLLMRRWVAIGNKNKSKIGASK
jgi:hypothetical protein